MTRLERRYRRLLRLLPAWYRAEREREMVDVFLEGRTGRDPDTEDLDAEYGWPEWGEAVSVAALAVRTRVGGSGAPPRSRAVGDTVRAAGVGAVLLLAAGAAVSLVMQIVVALVGPPEARMLADALLHPSGPGGWWSTVVMGLGLCWLPAWTALSSGRRRAALLLALAATTPVLVQLVRTVVEGPPAFAVIVLAGSLLDLSAVVLLAVGYHRDAPPPSVPAPWALLAVATVASVASGLLVMITRVAIEPTATIVLLATVVVAVVRRSRPLAGAVGVLAAITIVIGALELSVLEADRAGAVVTVALGLTSVLVATATARRRAPHRTYGSTGTTPGTVHESRTEPR